MVGFPLPFTQLNWTSVYPAQTSLPSQLSLSPQGTGQVFRVALPNQPGELCNQSTQFCPCLAPFLVEGRGGYFSQRHPPCFGLFAFFFAFATHPVPFPTPTSSKCLFVYFILYMSNILVLAWSSDAGENIMTLGRICRPRGWTFRHSLARSV